MAGIYDLTLAAGASENLSVTGQYIKITSAPSGRVRIKLSTGETAALYEGQGIRLQGEKRFRDVVVQNTASVLQKIEFFIGDELLEDSRITGTVRVLDSARVDVFSQIVFEGAASYTAPTGGKYSRVQAWNPVGSNRMLSIEELTLTVSAAVAVNIASTTFQEPTLWNVLANRYIGAAGALSSIRTGEQTAPGDNVASTLRAVSLSANSVYVMTPKHPWLLMPGQGLDITTVSGANITLSASFTAVEETI